MGWAEQGLKFLDPGYASPGQPRAPIFACEDADDGEHEDEGFGEGDAEADERAGFGEGDAEADERASPRGKRKGTAEPGSARPASNRLRALDCPQQGKQRFLFRRVKILRS